MTELFRPVGHDELELIATSKWRRFPPRLDEQPIFYPVVNESYAAQIARDWNTKGDRLGYVTRFEVDDLYVQQFPVQQVGDETHMELWVPAEELDEFNAHLESTISVTSVFVEDGPAGMLHPGLTSRVLHRLLADYGTLGAAATEIIARAVDHAGQPASERLAAALLFNSGGNLDQLTAQVQALAVDFRDVLVAADLADEDWPSRLADRLGPT